jgi:hypothetical protein
MSHHFEHVFSSESGVPVWSNPIISHLVAALQIKHLHGSADNFEWLRKTIIVRSTCLKPKEMSTLQILELSTATSMYPYVLHSSIFALSCASMKFTTATQFGSDHFWSL